MQPNVYGKTDLTYNDYLKVPELLKLQKPLSDPTHHDEHLFIIIHQTYELWFKLILHELERAALHMQAQEVLSAHHFLTRVTEILKLLVSQIHILKTMRPVDFLKFRDQLNPASGFQSLQFRELEFMAGLKDRRYFNFFQNRPDMIKVLEKRYADPDLKTIYYQMLSKFGFSIPEINSAPDWEDKNQQVLLDAIQPIYQEPQKNLDLYLLSESLVDLDELLILWRENHMHVVERIIGFKQGTGGSSGVEYLKSTATKKCFPILWQVRTVLKL